MTGAALTPEQLAAAKGKEELILKAIPDRTQKVQAPEPIQPKQRFGPRSKVMAAYRDRRGTSGCCSWPHNERHLGQIREVKADPKFPKS